MSRVLPYSYQSFQIIQENTGHGSHHSWDRYIIDGKEYHWVNGSPDLIQEIPGYYEWDSERRDTRIVEKSAGNFQYNGCFFEKLPLVEGTCPYCGESAYSPYDNDEFDHHSNDEFYVEQKIDAETTRTTFRTRYNCSHCGWWGIILGDNIHIEDYGYLKERKFHVSGTLRRFNVEDPDVCLNDLVFWLKRKETAIKDVDPFKFERLVCECLKNIYPECEVRLVGGRKDRGIDIYVAQSNDFPILVQVKRRTDILGSESVNTVRSLNGVLLRERKPYGMVVSTKRQFSRDSYKEIEDTANNGAMANYKVDLIAFDRLKEMIGGVKNDESIYAQHMQCESLENWEGKFVV